jgi:ribonucleotide reductase alpha subunit
MSDDGQMNVIKRNGTKEPVQFDKVLERIRKAAKGLSVNYTRLAQLVLAEIADGIHTTELDELASRIAISYSTTHPDWATLAAQIIVSNCQRSAPKTFSQAMHMLYRITDSQGKHSPALADDIMVFIDANSEALDAMIQPENDYLLDYFGFKTLERAYLMRSRGPEGTRPIVETPQYMWLRVAVGIHAVVSNHPHYTTVLETEEVLNRIKETYTYMSSKAFTHATPTLFNSATPRPQMSSCFLLTMKEDSIDGIFDTLKQCAQISKYAGGIGLSIHNIRAEGSFIAGTQGSSNGLVPMLRVFNNTARYVDQCFLPGTLVYTESGPKPIEDIGVGQRILTSTGKFENVKRPVRHEYSGPIKRLTIKHSLESINVTPEHNVLALKGQALMLNHSVIRNRLSKKLAQVDWVDIKDLEVNDFLAFTIPTYEKDIETLSEEDCRIYGIMLGDGHICTKEAGVTMHTVAKKESIDFMKRYLAMRGINAHESVDGNTTRLKWSLSDFKFSKSQLYTDTEKCMTEPFLHLPKSKILNILYGLISTDGCVGTKEICLEMTSKILLEQVRYIILRLGGLTSGYERDRIGNVSTYKNITTRKLSWCIRIPRLPEIMALFPSAAPSEYFTFFRYENMLLSRIQNIEDDTYNGIVHDFEVDVTHDYTVAHMGVAHNGGGRRNGSFAIYLEPWHADIQAFIKMKSNTGNEEERARDLFYALWICDLFMKRVEAGQDWSLFCPHEAPGLSDVYGAEFEALYLKYESEGRARKTVSAQKLWSDILVSQIETGTPYLLYKDAANQKSNQKNLGTIKSSNLCVAPNTEIEVFYPDKPSSIFLIQELENMTVTIWNGTGPSSVTVKKTGNNQELLRVIVEQTSNDESWIRHLDCTYYHKFITENTRPIKDAKRVEAQDLKPGMQLCTFKDSNGHLVHQKVVDVSPIKSDDTFCFSEPINHAGVFNDIFTGNCTEIMEFSSPEETAVCNLASIALPFFVKDSFDFDHLRKVVGTMVVNLNRVIDINFYPTAETKRSNMRHRPIGLGVQGLADVFAMLKIPWESPEAAALNQEIFEHIYYAALKASMSLSTVDGPYETFEGSPASQGILQPDLWGLDPASYKTAAKLDWGRLRSAIKLLGLRNSLLVAPMPTASTSQILGYNECIEPFTSNIYARRTLAGEFTVVNKYLVKDLMDLGLWTSELKDQIIGANGSVQGLAIPQSIKDLYKTVWEIKQKTLIDMAADRGAFICQSQSLNLFVSEPTIARLSSMHFYAWKKGLKTGLYYLRTKSAVQAIKFSLAATATATATAEECLLCSS